MLKFIKNSFNILEDVILIVTKIGPNLKSD